MTLSKTHADWVARRQRARAVLKRLETRRKRLTAQIFRMYRWLNKS